MLTVTVDGVNHSAPTVEELREMGIRPIVKHYRYAHYGGNKPSKSEHPRILRAFWERKEAWPFGGRTTVMLLHRDGWWAEGESRCSMRDQFSKRIGYVLAMVDAYTKLRARILDDNQAHTPGV